MATTSNSTTTTAPTWLAVDVGSSSVRSAGYSLTVFPDRPPALDDCRLLPGCHASAPYAWVPTAAEKAVTSEPKDHPSSSPSPSATTTASSTVDGAQTTAQALSALASTLDAVVAAWPAEAPAPTGVVFTSFAMSWLGLDAEGAIVTPLLTYADASPASAAAARRLRDELSADGAAAAHQRTGAPIHAAYAAVQLRRLAAEQPAQSARVVSWCTIVGALLRQLLAIAPDASLPVSLSEAAWTGLLNRSTLDWDAELTAHLPASFVAALPTVRTSPGPLPGARLAPASAARWPLLAKSEIHLAVGDGAAANVGSGAIGPHRVAVTIGTSAAMRVVLPRAATAVPPGLWSYVLSPQLELVGGALTDGGSMYQFALSLLGLNDCEDTRRKVEAEAEALPPAGHGLTVLPFLKGERATGWQDFATASLAGLTAQTTRAEVLRACLEAVALRLGAIWQRLQPALAGGQAAAATEDPARAAPAAAPAEVVAVASGTALAASPLWRRVLCDVLGVPLVFRPPPADARVDDTTARGALLLAAAAGTSTSTWAANGRQHPDSPDTVRLQPDADSHRAYQAALARQEALHHALADTYPVA